MNVTMNDYQQILENLGASEVQHFKDVATRMQMHASNIDDQMSDNIRLINTAADMCNDLSSQHALITINNKFFMPIRNDVVDYTGDKLELELILDNSVKCRDTVSRSSVGRAQFDTLSKGEFAEVLVLVEAAVMYANNVSLLSRDALKEIGYIEQECNDCNVAILRTRHLGHMSSEVCEQLDILHKSMSDIFEDIDKIKTNLDALSTFAADTVSELRDIHAILVKLKQNK